MSRATRRSTCLRAIASDRRYETLDVLCRLRRRVFWAELSVRLDATDCASGGASSVTTASTNDPPPAAAAGVGATTASAPTKPIRGPLLRLDMVRKAWFWATMYARLENNCCHGLALSPIGCHVQLGRGGPALWQTRLRADVAELVDAHGSGPCGGNPVEVQVLSSALAF